MYNLCILCLLFGASPQQERKLILPENHTTDSVLYTSLCSWCSCCLECPLPFFFFCPVLLLFSKD